MKLYSNKYRPGEIFNSGYFWDSQIETLTFKRNFYYIIERVLARSLNPEYDFPMLEKFYRRDLIIKIALYSPSIFGNKKIENICNYFNLSPKSFKNYINRELL